MLDTEKEVAKFDEIAGDYDKLHAASVTASGEDIDYFALYKLHRLQALGFPPVARVLDYGCGIGNLTQFLVSHFQDVSGYDPSNESVTHAQTRIPEARFSDRLEEIPADHFDLVVVAGVMHHIPPADRVQALEQVHTKLRAGGAIVVFEHNPYNPLTRAAVDACPFDDDAILLKPREVVRDLRSSGFQQIRQRFIVFFPRALAWLRFLEPYLEFCPLGAQTMTVARRAGT